MFENLKVSPILILLVFVLYTFQQIQDPEFKETLKKYRSECVEEIGIDLDFLKQIWKSNRYPNDDKLKCYFKCLHTKFGVMNEKGDVNDDKLKYLASHFHNDATKDEIVTECGGIEGADLCETAFKLMTCIKNATLD